MLFKIYLVVFCFTCNGAHEVVFFFLNLLGDNCAGFTCNTGLVLLNEIIFANKAMSHHPSSGMV